MPSEFQLIARHFIRPVRHTCLGVGDDAALIQPAAGCELAITTDMLVEGVHFPADAAPEALGWKALAVNLSDLAAMGATPRWAVLAAALPRADEEWIAAFARGFFSLAERFDVDVIGGDTTRGPLTLCPTVFGEVPAGRALRRDGARPGDDVWVSGTPGRAALGLAHLQRRARLAPGWREACVDALERPQPRIALGFALRGLAHAAIDVSDGLAADLGHVLERSGVAAEIDLARLPVAGLEAACADASLARRCALAGGDDYELAFTAPPALRDDLDALARTLDLPLHRIGRILPGPAVLRVLDERGDPVSLERAGYDHFA